MKDYILSTPVNDQDIITLREQGEVILKRIGQNTLYTFSSDIINLKEMVGDTVIYVTHRKMDGPVAELLMEKIFG